RHATTESLRSEKTVVEDQLRQAQAERAKLVREMEAMKRDLESTWETERVENAVLRERINDVAAEVARLTGVLEGPGSPIETILAADPAHADGGGNGNGHGDKRGKPANGEGSKGTLADRIRALQSRASRVPQAS